MVYISELSGLPLQVINDAKNIANQFDSSDNILNDNHQFITRLNELKEHTTK